MQSTDLVQDEKEYIIRSKHDRENPYVMISKNLINDTRLSEDERFYLIKFLSFPNYWKISPLHIQKTEKIGKQKFYRIINSLIRVGYMKRVHVLAGNLRNGCYYEISEEPIFSNNSSDTPVCGMPVAGEAEKKDSTKEEVLLKNKNTIHTTAPMVAFGEYVKLTQEFYDKKCSQHSKVDVDEIIDRINNYCKAHGKKYVNYSGAFATFAKTYFSSQKQSSPRGKESIKEKILQSFKRGNVYNGAECHHDEFGLGFTRGNKQKQIRWDSYNLKEDFENLLRSFDIFGFKL